MTLDIEEAIACGRAWVDLQHEAFKLGLVLRLEEVDSEPDLVRKAFDALTGDVPLRDHYPQGDPAEPPFTPRQVLLLAHAEFTVIDHRTEVYQEAVEKVRRELGRYEPRLCKGMTKQRMECRSYALAYAPEPYCTHHASQTERDINKELLRQEEELIRAELRSIDFDVISRRGNDG